MRSAITALLLSAAAALPAAAQTYNMPALQTPVLADREYNFVASSGSGAGTALLFQWREGLQPRWQMTADAGLAAPQGANVDTRILIGAAVAYQATRADGDFPFDVALTGGAGFSAGNADKAGPGPHAANGTVVRLPFGAAIGHTFDLDQGFQLTPFVHPRLSFDRCSSCNGGASDSKVNVDVDLGANLQITPQVALRVAGLVGGTDFLGGTNAVAFSVAWTPKGLRK
ncbi:MAG: hypothetical protein HYR75_08870 [Gemmatimonadetes bacterium]|nr:hypothetical protein [Gemmatimonadota bacterium]MBI3569405.1 hypothetical protein [Gemmatimonadota bacterium]